MFKRPARAHCAVRRRSPTSSSGSPKEVEQTEPVPRRLRSACACVRRVCASNRKKRSSHRRDRISPVDSSGICSSFHRLSDLPIRVIFGGRSEDSVTGRSKRPGIRSSTRRFSVPLPERRKRIGSGRYRTTLRNFHLNCHIWL